MALVEKSMNDCRQVLETNSVSEDGCERKPLPISRKFFRILMSPYLSASHNQQLRSQDGIVSMANKRVLVVDDEPDVRAVVRGCLEDVAGWDVITAASGEEGLVAAVTDRPDAIVLDVMMPGMDGLTFLKKLRTQPEGKSIPTILLTAKTSFPDPETFSALDIEGVICKPFDPFVLTQQIAAFLGWEMEAIE